ncbi:hypothetical protein KBC31_03210 [Candidatus Saccharibacteria bacterium]|nr:hypothetical protein [Candidatus Saccharibacteria bacterium]
MKKQDKPSMPKTNPTITKTNLATAFLAAILIAFPVGYIYGQSNAKEASSDNRINSIVKESMDHGEMKHEDFTLSDGDNIPEIKNLMVSPDKKSGWNVSFDTKNFKFAPESASENHVDGEGHAHLYVDGKKISRLYSNNYYIENLQPGRHTIRVSLNTNDHRELHLPKGDAIEQIVEITQK